MSPYIPVMNDGALRLVLVSTAQFRFSSSNKARQAQPAGLGFTFILIFKDAVASGTKTVEINDEHVLVFINSVALA